MYSYNDIFKTKWSKKIVYAPNGFGKTTNSKKLADRLEEDGKKVKYFSQKELENLISTFDEEFFVGPTAKLETERLKIQKELEAINPFVKAVGANSMVSAKKSFALSYYGIKKASDYPKSFKKDINNIAEKYSSYSVNDILEMDKSLDYHLYNEIITFIKNIDYKTIINDGVNNLGIDKLVYESIYSLFIYSKLNGFSDCLLCGRHYKNSNSLLKAIENHLSELEILQSESNYRKLNSLIKKIIEDKNRSNSKIINEVYKNLKSKTIKQKYIFLKVYVSLCDDDIKLISNKVSDIQINEEENVYDYLERIIKIDKKIEEKETIKSNNKSKIKRFNEFVVNEINKIIHFDSDVSVEPSANKKGFVFKANNKKLTPEKFLSTSEFKRLVLIVLYAEIKYSSVDVLILDDPIDSYDDYTKLLAINYINIILKSRKLKDWYLLTNDFECASYLSEIRKCNVIFYLVNPDCVYSSANYSYWDRDCTYKEVLKIGKNDLVFLSDFITKKATNYDCNKEIMLCGLTIPLRNIRSTIIKKFGKVEVLSDPTWESDVRTIIESCFEHYRPLQYKSPTATIRSATIEIKDVANLFLRLHTSRRNVPSTFLSDRTPIVDFRKNIVQRPFGCILTGTYTDVINYLFLKALMIENIKYEFEKKIIDKGYASFSQIDMDNVLDNAYGLFSVINGIDNLNKRTPVIGIDTFLRRVLKIHDNYSIIYNAIDHSTTRMVSPYLSLSLWDIKSFKKDVELL